MFGSCWCYVWCNVAKCNVYCDVHFVYLLYICCIFVVCALLFIHRNLDCGLNLICLLFTLLRVKDERIKVDAIISFLHLNLDHPGNICKSFCTCI